MEVPIQVEALTRFKNKQWVGNKKAEVNVCGPRNFGFSEEVRCEECGAKCFYTNNCRDLKKKNIKKICIKCALEKYSDDLNDEMKDILRRVVENGKNNKET